MKTIMDISFLQEHLDPYNKLSDEEWEEFLEESSDRLFEYCLEEGQDFLEEWLISKF